MKKIEKDGRGLIVPKRIDFFKFSLPYYRYYGIRIINYSNITKDFKKLGKHCYWKIKKDGWIECEIRIENNHSTATKIASILFSISYLIITIIIVRSKNCEYRERGSQFKKLGKHCYKEMEDWARKNNI